MMRRPDFFIVGAPKCGTTAMYEYLRSHPRVFMPEEKEPHFFSPDLPWYRKVSTEEEYLALFREADESHRAVGEASVWYLFSRDAAPAIRDFAPDARILVFFRNPVEFVQSMHAQFAYTQNRPPDFEAAWREQREGESVSELVRFGRFGEQFERLLEVVPRNQILTVLLDDLRQDARREYLRVLDFLGVEDDGRTEFPRVNARKVHRSRWLAEFIDRTPAPLVSAWMRFKDWVGVREVGLLDRLRGLNAKPIRKPEIDPELRAEVASAFREDIRLLSGLLQRDLSHWR